MTTIPEVVTTGPDGGGYSDEVIAAAMEAYDVQADVAEEILEAQEKLVDYAIGIQHEGGYAGFMVTPSGASGVLAVVPGSHIEPPPDLPITVVEARLSERELPRFDATLSEALREAGHPEVMAVRYDPFTDEVIVWVDPELPKPWPTTGWGVSS